MSRFLKWFLVVITVAMLAACGGGGGGDNNDTAFSTLKKTGQTKSYDENGNEVTDGSLKDDGYYQKGATPNYTRDDTKEIVTDHVTGLMWQDDAEAATVTKQWLTDANYNTCFNGAASPACNDTSGDTAATYCANLTLGGYTDWRLPTLKELEGIVNYGNSFPAIDTTFQNVNSYDYWSDTTNANFKGIAWGVSFRNGFVSGSIHSGNGHKNGSKFVRCVRDGQ